MPTTMPTPSGVSSPGIGGDVFSGPINPSRPVRPAPLTTAAIAAHRGSRVENRRMISPRSVLFMPHGPGW